MLGPGGGDVQPALAAVAQQRPPLVPHPAVRVLAVADGQDDRVPLVALHPLQVLDEERLGRVLGEEALEVRRRRDSSAARSAASIRSACLMPSAMTPSDSCGRPRACSRISSTTLSTSAVTDTSWPGSGLLLRPPRGAGSPPGAHRGTWSARRRRCARWRTPPAARPGCGSARSAAQSAAAAGARRAPTRSPRRTRPGSPRPRPSASASPNWRKKLVGGSCRSSPATTIWCAADDRRDRVGRDDLAGLVEDDHVEQPGGGQHLADHQRGHRPARLEREQHVAAWSSSRRSGRWPRRSAACLRMTRACSGCRSWASRSRSAQARRTRARLAARCSTSRTRKSLGDLVQRGAAVGRVARVADPDLVQDRGVPGVVERGRGQVAVRLPAGQLVQQRAQPHLGRTAAPAGTAGAAATACPGPRPAP